MQVALILKCHSYLIDILYPILGLMTAKTKCTLLFISLVSGMIAGIMVFYWFHQRMKWMFIVHQIPFLLLNNIRGLVDGELSRIILFVSSPCFKIISHNFLFFDKSMRSDLCPLVAIHNTLRKDFVNFSCI